MQLARIEAISHNRPVRFVIDGANHRIGVLDTVGTPAFGDDIVLLGSNTGELGGSEYLYVTADLVAGQPPSVDLEGERALQQAVLKMNHEELLTSAHDCSEGGLAASLAQCALGDGEAPFGVDVTLDEDLRPVVSLFGESQGRILVSVSPANEAAFLSLFEGLPCRLVGNTHEDALLRVHGKDGGLYIEESLPGLRESYKKTLWW